MYIIMKIIETKKKASSGILFVIAVCLALAGRQHSFGSESIRSGGRLNALDYTFVTTAAHNIRMDLALGHIGNQNSTNPAVKAFAQKMVDDNQKALEELTLLATQKGISLPESASVEDKNQLGLGALLGADFDPPYMKCMVGNSKRGAKLFHDEADEATDPDLQAWANKNLPMFQDHLQSAQDLYATFSIAQK